MFFTASFNCLNTYHGFGVRLVDSFNCIIITFIVPQCPALTSPTNGRMTCSLGSDNLPTNRDTCAFTCDANYQLVGSSSRTCEAPRRKWTGNDALCKKSIISLIVQCYSS